MLTAFRRSIPGSRRPQRAAGTPGAAAGLAPLSSTSTLGENITYAVARSKFGAHLLPAVNGTRKYHVRSLSCPPSGSPSAEWAAISTGRAAAQSGPVVESPNRFGGPALGNRVARSYYMGRTNGNLGRSHTGEYAGASSAGGSASMSTATMHCSSGSSSGGSNSRRWFWTAAAVTAVTAAATVANASSTTSCKTEASGWTSSKKGSVSATSPAAGGEGRGRESGGCDCGCGGKVNDRHRVNDRHEVNDRHGVSDQPKINDHDHDHQQHQHQQPQHQSRGLPASSGCIADTAAEHPLSPSPSPPAGGAYAGREGAESPLWRSTSRPPELWGEDEHGEEGGPRGVSDLRGGGRALSSIAGAGEQGEGGVGVGGEGEGEGGGGEGGGEDGSKGKSVPLAGRPLFTSVTSTKGHRPHMEDEFFLSTDGSFSAVYDGHGGANVSKYLRRNLYKHFMDNLPPGADAYDVKTVERALKAAYKTADDYVITQTPYGTEGSCAVSVTVHCDREGKASIISANLGDSRAVLSRGGKALDLTEDHKPNSPAEMERIYRHDGMVTWEGFECSQGLQIEGTGVYRINGNLAVARAIGDIDYRPWVSGEAEIKTIEMNRETDQFVILASDGLWDVMTSEEAVQYVHAIMGGAMGAAREGDKWSDEHRDTPPTSSSSSSSSSDKATAGRTADGERPAHMTLINWTQSYAEDRGMIRAATMLRKKKMARYLTAEALRRGSMDNTTVAIVWLQ